MNLTCCGKPVKTGRKIGAGRDVFGVWCEICGRQGKGATEAEAADDALDQAMDAAFGQFEGPGRAQAPVPMTAEYEMMDEDVPEQDAEPEPNLDADGTMPLF